MLLSLLVGALSLAADTTAVYNGRLDQVHVAIPRIEADVKIDGTLDDPAWRRAALLTGFSQFAPVDQRPASDSTEVLVWYSSTAIYFGIRAFEAHGAVHATLADRDKIAADDNVQIYLDTFNDGRQAYVFGVNPLGVQADGTLSEGNQSRTAGFAGAAAVRDTIDPSADFIYQSRGHVTADGYVVEIRIPFRSLRYGAGNPLTWGVQVVRQVQHSGYQDTWTQTKRANASFLGQSGRLEGLTDLSSGHVFDINPELTAVSTGSPRAAPSTGWQYVTPNPNLGGNVRYGLTNNLLLNATVKPDFSQIEADVTQVSYDPRSALFYPEKRPFFLDGFEKFDTPNQLIYTRNIVQPVAAGKLTGKIGDMNIGILSAVDDPSTSLYGDRPVYNLMRLREDIGRSATLGMVYTDKEDGSYYNRVGELDGRVVFGGVYSARSQVALSETKGGDEHAPLFEGVFQRDGRTLGLRYSITGVSHDFVAASGFISRADLVTLQFDQHVTFYGNKGALIESWTTGIAPSTNWNYNRFWDGKGGNDPKLKFNNQLTLRGGWTLSASVFFESFKYDPTLFTTYRIQHPVAGGGFDTLPYVGAQRLPNLDIVNSFSTPQWKQFDLYVQAITGYDENFYEWSNANIVLISVALNWRPTDRIRVNGLYSHQEYIRRDDHTEVAVRRIPRIKVEYQLSRPIFFRLVGQYDAQYVDALRDDSRTNDPILIYNSASRQYVLSQRFTSNGFRADALFSYQPTPGTVIFVGYGSSLVEPDAFSFQNFQRTADNLFVKFSYVFSAGSK